jgi:hypothetical protein
MRVNNSHGITSISNVITLGNTDSEILVPSTNDALQNFEVSTAQDRLGAMLDRIISALPNTVTIISTLIPNLNAAAEANIEIINANLPAMVQERADNGALVYLADMHTGYITDADITQSDGTHPTDGK